MTQSVEESARIVVGIHWDTPEGWYVWHASETADVTARLRTAAGTDAAGEALVRSVVDVDHQVSLIEDATVGAIWVPDPSIGAAGVFGYLSVLPVDGRDRRAPKQYRRALRKRSTVSPDGWRTIERATSLTSLGEGYMYVHMMERKLEPEQQTIWSCATSTLFMENTLGVIEVSTRTPHMSLQERHALIHAELANVVVPIVDAAP